MVEAAGIKPAPYSKRKRRRRATSVNVVPLLGEIIRMPGLPAQPLAERMDLINGKVVGLLGG